MRWCGIVILYCKGALAVWRYGEGRSLPLSQASGALLLLLLLLFILLLLKTNFIRYRLYEHLLLHSRRFLKAWKSFHRRKSDSISNVLVSDYVTMANADWFSVKILLMRFQNMHKLAARKMISGQDKSISKPDRRRFAVAEKAAPAKWVSESHFHSRSQLGLSSIST